jgi:quinol monooxygenase YgiN
MTELIIRTRLHINDGAMEEFQAEAARWVEAAAVEPGTSGYEVFINHESRQAIFLEVYADGDAFLAHSRAITADALAALYGAASLVDYEIYGNPGPEVRKVLEGPAYIPYRSK